MPTQKNQPYATLNSYNRTFSSKANISVMFSISVETKCGLNHDSIHVHIKQICYS